jgi:hypothetical protein
MASQFHNLAVKLTDLLLDGSAHFENNICQFQTSPHSANSRRVRAECRSSLASRIMLNGVSDARLTHLNPPDAITYEERGCHSDHRLSAALA